MKKMSAFFMTTTLALALTGCGKPLSELGKLADTLKQESTKESDEPEEFEEPQESEIIVNPEDTLLPTDSEVTNDLHSKSAGNIQFLPRNKDSENTAESQEASEPDPDSIEDTYDVDGIKGYNFDDLNGNGTPDEDEITDEALLNAEGKIEYIDYTDKNLSEDEIKEKISDIEGTLMYLSGQLTYEELLREL